MEINCNICKDTIFDHCICSQVDNFVDNFADKYGLDLCTKTKVVQDNYYNITFGSKIGDNKVIFRKIIYSEPIIESYIYIVVNSITNLVLYNNDKLKLLSRKFIHSKFVLDEKLYDDEELYDKNYEISKRKIDNFLDNHEEILKNYDITIEELQVLFNILGFTKRPQIKSTSQ